MVTRVSWLFITGALSLLLTLASPLSSLGRQAGSEADSSGPAVVPTPTVTVTPPPSDVADEPEPAPAVETPVSRPTPAAVSEGSVTGPDVVPTPIASPVADQSSVIAQGTVELALEEVVWQVNRYEADTPTEAPFAERALGFVLALDGELALVDQASGEATLLDPGDAAFVRPGAMQQWTSQSEAPVHYLAIALVAAATAHDAPNGEVLHVSAPFAPSPGLHGLVLNHHRLPLGRVLSVPDTGERNLLFVLDGAVISQSAGGLAPATLVTGEGTVFRGAWEISLAEDDQGDTADPEGATIVIASIA